MFHQSISTQTQKMNYQITYLCVGLLVRISPRRYRCTCILRTRQDKPSLYVAYTYICTSLSKFTPRCSITCYFVGLCWAQGPPQSRKITSNTPSVSGCTFSNHEKIYTTWYLFIQIDRIFTDEEIETL